MKAVVLRAYGSPDDLRVEDVDPPAPAAGEVLVRVHAASVNDWDWALVRGSPPYIRLLAGLRRPRVAIPGVDVAGTVAAVGAGAERFRPGDAVYGDLSESGFGAFAELVSASERALAPKPAGVSFVEAAALPHAAMLALQGLRDAGGLRPGERLLVNGAGGGVGTLAVQIARHLGVTDVTGVDSADKAAMMRSIGYARTIDYRQEDFTAGTDRYDLVLDATSDRSAFAYARVLAPGGRYVTVGGRTGSLLQVAALGRVIGRARGTRLRVLALRPNQGLDELNELVEAGAVRPVIDGPYPLDELPRALRRFGEGRHLGKIVVTTGAPDGA